MYFNLKFNINGTVGSNIIYMNTKQSSGNPQTPDKQNNYHSDKCAAVEVSTLTIRDFGVKKSFAKEVSKDYFIATTIAAAILKKCSNPLVIRKLQINKIIIIQLEIKLVWLL
jgi:hypothetical protein